MLQHSQSISIQAKLKLMKMQLINGLKPINQNDSRSSSYFLVIKRDYPPSKITNRIISSTLVNNNVL